MAEQLEGMEIRRFRYAPTAWQSLAYQGGIMANLKSKRWRFLLVPGFILAEFVALVRAMRQLHIDVIHAHWLLPQGLVAILAGIWIGERKPVVVCTSHGSDLFGLKGWLLDRLMSFVLRRSNRITVVSSALGAVASTLSGRSDIQVIPMGVDLLGKFVPDASVVRSGVDLLFVGRLVQEKGLKHAIEALSEVLVGHPHVRLVVVGNGPEKAPMESLARNLGVAEQVSFIGSLDNAKLPDLYRRASMLVGPSLREGLGLVFVEALGCECPVVAFDLPAIRDVVHDGVTGLLAKPGSSRDLADKIKSLLDDAARRQELGRAGRRHVLHGYSWETIAQRYAKLLESDLP